MKGKTMDLKQRIERLEKQNKTLRFFCGVTLVAVICLTAMGAMPAIVNFKTVRAQKFQLIDATGHTRGEMGVNNLGPYVHFDERQTRGNLASMGIANGVPHVTLEKDGRTKSITP